MAMVNLPTTTQYSAYSGIAFPPRRAATGFFAMETDVALINDSIQVLLSTKKGSMPMMPSFGSSAQDLLFEAVNDVTQSLVASAIQADINLWEPRVTVNSIMAASTDNTRVFQLSMTINATGQLIKSTFSLPAI